MFTEDKSQHRPTLIGLTGGETEPSARFRWRQHIAYFSKHFEVSESISRLGAHYSRAHGSKGSWLLKGAAENAKRALRARNFDVKFLQRNMMSRMYTWEYVMGGPFVFDVDDAIFMHQIFGGVDRVARKAEVIVCGNKYLADYFCEFGRVEVIPTAVDTDYFTPASSSRDAGEKVIVWSGSSSGFRFLEMIAQPLRHVLERFPNARLRVVSDRFPRFIDIPERQLDFELWSPAREVDVLRESDIGIMPLDDTLWSRGKCSFKMLTYMATALPAVVSPVGMNEEILALGPCGLAARTNDEWVDALSLLLVSGAARKAAGAVGRSIAEANFSRAKVGRDLVAVFKSV